MVDPITVRTARDDDHAAILPLFERFYREEGFGDAAKRVPANLNVILERDDTAAFVADGGGRPVGVAAISTSFGLEVGLYAELEDLYVLPEWRRKGVATRLVEAAARWAIARGCHDMEAVLTPRARATPGLCDWYAMRGFADTGRIIIERSLEQE